RLSLNQGYYRLPSTGRLVKEFFQFGVAISNHEICARLAWLLAQIIEFIEKKHGKPVKWIVSVTRPMMSLAMHLTENYFVKENREPPAILAESTIEELEFAGRKKEGTAVFLT